MHTFPKDDVERLSFQFTNEIFSNVSRLEQRAIYTETSIVEVYIT